MTSAWSLLPPLSTLCSLGYFPCGSEMPLYLLCGLFFPRNHLRASLGCLWSPNPAVSLSTQHTVIARGPVSLLTRPWTVERGLRFLMCVTLILYKNDLAPQLGPYTSFTQWTFCESTKLCSQCWGCTNKQDELAFMKLVNNGFIPFVC